MTIQNINTGTTGEEGINPRFVRIQCDDSYATITTANYLKEAESQGYTFLPTDEVHVTYASNALAVFTPLIQDGNITLEPAISEGSVTLPVVSGNFPKFSGTTGLIADSGISPSNAAKTKAVMANGATIVDHIACFTDTAGTAGDNPTTAINGGNLQAGLSGTAGYVASFPATASKGSLHLTAVANTGNTVTTISNAAMGQASVVSIPDPGTATAKFVVAPTALVNNNLVKANGTTGLVQDAGARIISGTTAPYAGGGTSNVFAVPGLTVASVGAPGIRTSTNTVSIAKSLPGTDTLTVTFSADPGASTTVDYIYTTAAQT